ncbi:MAG: hypothetical protein QME73_07275 [Bacillota bacterium]|nr:hypothetical protein [Bacillota bacterium]
MIIKAFICEGPDGVDLLRDMGRNGISEYLRGVGTDCRVFDDYIIAKAPIFDTMGYIRIDFGGVEEKITKIEYQVLSDEKNQRKIFEELYIDMEGMLGSPAVEDSHDNNNGDIPVVVWENNNIRAELSSIEIYGLYLLIEITRTA